ncbi:hypothetical protein ACO22_00843 [Paracoccidioides brasiliensis]|uniref:Uncharacterized protein n=1 Tax=Paracoccidioides brasiliensis TaxID=121759 RepID=A0A1D2JNA2_PARBR|nr:hypothetical protein ACO22_00843 [Paracoccidioides brasiliensis]ODH50851.1 hypothetical protein GX48_02993 [Paracoccidioides brasiliensis]
MYRPESSLMVILTDNTKATNLNTERSINEVDATRDLQKRDTLPYGRFQCDEDEDYIMFGDLSLVYSMAEFPIAWPDVPKLITGYDGAILPSNMPMALEASSHPTAKGCPTPCDRWIGRNHSGLHPFIQICEHTLFGIVAV